MVRSFWVFLLLVTAVFAIAQPVPPPVAQQAQSAQGQTQPEGEQTASAADSILRPEGSADLLEGIIEDYNYDPKGKRDPFKPFVENENLNKVITTPPVVEPMLPLERFDLDQLKLIGIIWGGKSAKAMFLDPNERTYIVRKNERIGRNRGYIAAIREGEVIVVEPLGKDGVITYKTRILRLQNAEKKK